MRTSVLLLVLLLINLTTPLAAEESGIAAWIWDADPPADKVFFRTVITVAGEPKSASIAAACDNGMVAYVNGNKVLQNGSWDVPKRGDILKYLRPGANLIAVEATNAGGPAGLLARIDVESTTGKKAWLSGKTWTASTQPADGWKSELELGQKWGAAHVVGPVGVAPWTVTTSERLASARVARPVTATAGEAITVHEGFEVELLYSVPMAEQGSWVSLAVDPHGRLITSDQYGKLYLVTPPTAGQPIKIETIPVDVGTAHGLLWAFDSLYVVAGEREQGLYRVQDSNGDGNLDKVTKLREFRGGGEHGPHSIILSPDGKSIYVCAGNHTDLPAPEESRVPRVWQEDQLLPRMWDAGGHAVGKMAPGGWICKTDPEGKIFELVSMGFRNEFDIAFNADGELFTYDADMEWDIGSPWYRPTRVCHATNGSEFGWRSGTGKWPNYYLDSLPSAVDIGPGSPTGITFGYGAKFPAAYQKALYICDWSYGKLYAVHLTPDGSSYTGNSELFATASPFALTDIVVNSHDGAMYFATGGRRTQSGLYRIRYVGNESTKAADATNAAGKDARELRHDLESLVGKAADDVVAAAWPHLAHGDRFVRFAARTALEHLPPTAWQDRIASERNVDASLLSTLALARSATVDPRQLIVGKLSRLSWSKLTRQQQLDLLRVYGVTFARHGEPSAAGRRKVLSQVDGALPAGDTALNLELARILIYLNAPNIVERTVGLIQSSPTQEEQINYALFLRGAKEGWTTKLRRAYFSWFVEAGMHRGGHSFGGFLRNIRTEAAANLSKTELAELGELVKQSLDQTPPEGPPRDFVKKWIVDDLLDVASSPGKRSFEHGRELFAAAACFKCHRVQGRGGIIGPDLTGVGKRFDNKYLLESLIEPSKVVSDQYQATVFVLDDGKIVTGKIANLGGDSMSVITNMLEPGSFTNVPRTGIEEQFPSKTSMMPADLLNTLSEKEILDLMAFLKAGGDPNAAAYSD
jgi:putative heme-binding domain-containing protein